MAELARKTCDALDEVKKEYLPNIETELIIEVREAEREGKPSLDIVDIKYKQGTNLSEKLKGFYDKHDKGYNVVDSRDEKRFVQVIIPMEMETLFKLSEDKDIESISRATSVP